MSGFHHKYFSLLCDGDQACCLNFDNIETGKTVGYSYLGSLVTKLANNKKHKTTRKLAIYANYNKKHETQFGGIQASSSSNVVLCRDAIAPNPDSNKFRFIFLKCVLDLGRIGKR